MARKRTGRTLAEDVYGQLRREIFTGKRRPGSRLQLKEIAEVQGVSLSVVREAATRLTSEGLAESTPQVGFRVRTLSLDDLLDLTWTRVHLESIALRESIGNGDVGWEADVVAAHHRLVNTPAILADGSVSPDWMTAHDGFHAALVSACGSLHLRRLRQQLFDASELYRYWSAALGHDDFDRRMVEIDAQHREILDAALARDADRAALLVSEHLRHTTAALKRAAELADDVSDAMRTDS
jgi:DNA-binding GntR family transcriptional regulator